VFGASLICLDTQNYLDNCQEQMARLIQHDTRRNVAVKLLRAGLVDVATAAEWCGVSRQRVHQWCEQHGINPRQAARNRMIAALSKEEDRMSKRRRTP
jgi:predicted HTH domain antitoxin